MRSSEIALGILIMGMMLVAAGAASAQTLPRALWSITANGFMGDLHITSVDNQGNLSGTVFGQSISGFWDEASQKITFMRIINPADPSTFQIYTGFLFRDQNRPDLVYTLTGFFEAFQGTGVVISM
jgi:hypothetical protein